MPLLPGQILNNRYRIVKLLGEGAFGAVYKAWDISLGGPCAVKENKEISPESANQFLVEASLLYNLKHANLPKVSNVFSIPGQGQYLVMEYIEGSDLETLLRQAGGRLPEAQVLPWIIQVCDALAYMHSRTPPIIHRDIKPANIRITPEGQAILVDFGIAKIDPAKDTPKAARALTPGYAPFEQYGQFSTDARSDIYALGATLYHLLTGHLPPESIERVARDTLASPRLLNPGISPRIEAVVLRAMAVMPGKRWQNAVEFKKAISVQQAPPRPLSRKWIGGVAALGLAVLVLWALLSVGNGKNDIAATQTALARAIVPATEDVRSATEPPLTERSKPTETFTPWPSTATRTITRTPSPFPVVDLSIPPVSASAGDTWTRPADGMVMVYVPAGEFLMGSSDADANADSDEKPQHKVFLDAYWIDRTEVTNVMFRRFVQAVDYQTEAEKAGFSWVYNPTLPNWEEMAGADWQHPRSPASSLDGLNEHPVVQVSWNDAQAYCQWVAATLPSEAQWEKAARGTDGRIYPWGNDFDGGRLNFCDRNCPYEGRDSNVDDGWQFTAPVGSYRAGASPYGALDMAGNVKEWVQDWYSLYGNSLEHNPTGPGSGEGHVLRGGSWLYDARVARSTLRDMAALDFRLNAIGFRCAARATPTITLLPAKTYMPTTQTPSTLTTLAIDFTDKVGVKMALVPAREFLMGSPDSDVNAASEEKPQHKVYLDAFYIDIYEVTNSLYALCVQAGACLPPGRLDSGTRSSYYENPDYADFPVNWIDWYDAQIFCEWRGSDLPAEAQWEKAARGGLAGALYPWGDEAPICQAGAHNGANFRGCYHYNTDRVGSYAPNGYGLFDMAGNVEEWVSDWHMDTFYRVPPFESPEGAAYSFTLSGLRGGEWSSKASYLRAASRGRGNPFGGTATRGFRCARMP